MVDPFAYCQFNRHEVVSLRSLESPTLNTTAHVYEHYIHRPPLPPPPPPSGHMHRPRPMLPPSPPRPYRCDRDGKPIMEKNVRPEESEQTKLSDEQLLICVPFVRGYSFKTKEWGMSPFFNRCLGLKLTVCSPSPHRVYSPCPMDRRSL
jgi:hypothetical protein